MYWCQQMIKFRSLCFVLTLFCGTTYAATNAEYLQTKLNTIKTMRASFSQVINAQKVAPAKSFGNMALAKPNHFFWKTLKPMPQLFIADGNNLWIYDEELEQVSVRRQGKNLSGAAAIFLSDKNHDIAKDFHVELLKSKGYESFDLRAKGNHASFIRVGLVFVGDIIKQIDLYDELGQHTKVLFSNVQLNSKLSPSLFKFIVPKGTDVVRQ